jgi:hypothetical protein
LKPANGQPASPANGGTISFAAPGGAAAGLFHQSALSGGGKGEGAVGPRGWAPNACAGSVRDVAGNTLAAYCGKPE